MNRAALEHILRAASAIVHEREFIVIGSQTILGQYPDAPDSLLVSIEPDVYSRYAPERSDVVDGAIGELSHGCFPSSDTASYHVGLLRGAKHRKAKHSATE